MLIMDEESRYIDVNDAACEILGRTREELLGAEVGTFLEHKGDIGIILDKVRRGGSLRAEISILRPDGQPCQLEFSAVANFQPGRHLIAIRDMTPRRHLDEQIRNASKMEAVGRLAGGVAHDFNNLLMVISSYTELILDTLGESDPLRRKAHEILKASSRAAGLTRQLLAFSRKQVLDPQLQDFNSLVKEMSKLLGRVLGEDVSVALQLSEEIGRVYADRSQIEQILMHLAVNARDVMPTGGRLTISTADMEFNADCERLPGSPPQGSYVMLAVEDTGTGMSKEVLSHLFEPFFSTKGTGKGTGLGLAAVYGIVKQSGGYIWVDSEIGKGSRFHMYFPRATKTPAEAPKIYAQSFSSARIPVLLLVEDEEALRQAATDFLKMRGYTVLSARDAAEALNIVSIRSEKIDVLITDLVMPGLSGRLLAQELVKISPETRIMYMSGYSDAAVLEDAAMDQTSAFLRKPFRMDALSAKIREVLGVQGETTTGPA